MGRYYWGDIEGKFAFGIQSSWDATHFGGREEVKYVWNCGCVVEDEAPTCACVCDSKLHSQAHEVIYTFDESDLLTIREELKRCKQFLDTVGNLTSKEEIDVVSNASNDVVVIYYRHELGMEILQCVEEKGYCKFHCEL